MKKRLKLLIILTCVIMIAVCMSVGFTACDSEAAASRKLNELANETALFLLGNDAYSWNTLSVNPQQSYGYERYGDPKWYSYSPLTDSDVKDIRYAFNYLNKKFAKIKVAKLHDADVATYYSLKHALNTYTQYYGSDYVKEFSLIDSGYINSQGGYVADFTSMAENYSLRNKDDIQDLLSMFLSCKDAFSTYIDYARDRVSAGYPLYDSSINSMIEYLDEVVDMGDSYYLYDYTYDRIDGLSFLSDSEKTNYKNSFRIAINDSFMSGVRTLSSGLASYRGNVKTTNKSYLASYGNIGKELYSWLFNSRTGADTEISSAYLGLCAAYEKYGMQAEAIADEIDAVKDTNAALYNEFYAYVDGDKKPLGLTDPEEILSYLKSAAKDIVPDLISQPNIDLKYMDDTAGKRTPVIAYYILSPLDETDSTEHITLNPYYIQNSPDEVLLTTMAHEGYPGHLYAYVNAKEKGASLMSTLMSVKAFSEGWAVYAQITLLKNIADSTQDTALKKFCEYTYSNTVANYLIAVIMDIQINYLGVSVQDYVGMGMDEDYVRNLMELIMEDPTMYVPYGYGIYSMLNLHDKAKSALGDKYNEVEFNGILLSDGMGPALSRAEQITSDYIKSK
ncbi:MAG: DUF885 domain-containing protein [Clostridia bacterium]|nr:DUF885 domain-containing protein [Clostridia bacterium]